MRFPSVLAMLLVLAFAPVTVAAAPSFSFETIDAVEVRDNSYLLVTGVRTGQSTASTATMYLGNDDLLSKCEKLALLSLAKPGVYRLEVTEGANCKLIRRTP